MIKERERQASPEAQAYTDWIMARHRMTEIATQMKALVEEQERLTAILAKGNPMDLGSVEISEFADYLMAPERETPPPTMRMADITAKFGVTKKTVYRWINDLKFPKATIIKNVAYWHDHQVQTWWELSQDKVGRWPSA